MLFLYQQRGGLGASTVNLRGDCDEKHVARLEYDVTCVAYPNVAGEGQQKHGTGGQG